MRSVSHRRPGGIRRGRTRWRRAGGIVTTESLLRGLEVERELHRRICAELRRRQHEEAIYPHDVAKAVHGQAKPDASVGLRYVHDMVDAICRRRWGAL